MNPDQLAAFRATGGFTPDASSVLLVGAVFAVALLWGVWALRTAYTGWSTHQVTSRQFLMVAVRFVAIYVVLTYFLLS